MIVFVKDLVKSAASDDYLSRSICLCNAPYEETSLIAAALLVNSVVGLSDKYYFTGGKYTLS